VSDEDPLDSALTLVMVADVAPEAVAAFQAYEAQVLPLLARHGGKLERRLRSRDGLSEVHVISFASRGGYEAALADPERMRQRSMLTGLTLEQRFLEVVEVHEP
jgi:hypothetical protein